MTSSEQLAEYVRMFRYEYMQSIAVILSWYKFNNLFTMQSVLRTCSILLTQWDNSDENNLLQVYKTSDLSLSTNRSYGLAYIGIYWNFVIFESSETHIGLGVSLQKNIQKGQNLWNSVLEWQLKPWCLVVFQVRLLKLLNITFTYYSCYPDTTCLLITTKFSFKISVFTDCSKFSMSNFQFRYVPWRLHTKIKRH